MSQPVIPVLATFKRATTLFPIPLPGIYNLAFEQNSPRALAGRGLVVLELSVLWAGYSALGLADVPCV